MALIGKDKPELDDLTEKIVSLIAEETEKPLVAIISLLSSCLEIMTLIHLPVDEAPEPTGQI
jgi:hypothetical protein